MSLQAACVLAGALALSACGGSGSSGSPTAPTSTAANPAPTAPTTTNPSFTIGFSAATSYTATLGAQTFSAPGAFPVSLAPGTYEISGSFTGDTLGIVFVSVLPANGGVQSNSVQSLSGPSPFATSCGVLYNGFGSAAQSFRLRFTVGTNANSTCRG